jgi:transposase
MEQASLPVDGILLNADAGFDSKALHGAPQSHGFVTNIAVNKRDGERERGYVFDKQLYKERFKVERTNAWFDAYRAVKTRTDKLKQTWLASQYLAACCIILHKLNLLIH